MPHRYPLPTPAAGSPLDQAQAAFDRLTCGPHPVTVDGRAFAGLPARPMRLDQLRDRLHERRCPAGTRDAAWAFLVHRARREADVWTIACVGCALPGLLKVSRRLSRGLPAHPTGLAHPHRLIARSRSTIAGVPAAAALDRQPRDHQPRHRREPWADHRQHWLPVAAAGFDVEAAVLAGFLAELAVVDLTRPRVVGRLRSAAHEAGMVACREMAHAPIPRVHLFTSCPPPPPARHPDLVLARAVAARAITNNEAALIGSTRLEPISLAEVAVLRGQSYRDVRAARIRAERKLSVYLREQDTGPIEVFLSRTTATRSPNHPRPRSGIRSSTGTPRTGEGRGDSTGENSHRENRGRRRDRPIGTRRPRSPDTPSTPDLGPASATARRGLGLAGAATDGPREAGETASTASPLPHAARRIRRRRRALHTPLPVTPPSPASPTMIPLTTPPTDSPSRSSVDSITASVTSAPDPASTSDAGLREPL